MQDESRVNYHIIGGLGDVALTRKLTQIYSPALRDKVRVRSLVDVYPAERLASRESMAGLFDEIKQKHIKGKLEDFVVDEIIEGISSGKVKYFQARNSEAYSSFFSYVNSLPDSAIDISSPNKTHLELFCLALSQTKAHVSIEKPVVPYQGDLAKIKSFLSAHGSGRVLMDAEHYAYYGNIRHYLENFDKFVTGSWVSDGKLEPLGKIKGLILHLEEEEGFDSIRNQNVIDKRISGGGILLDLGPHCFSFLKCLGAAINSKKISCEGHKADFPQIADGYHGETDATARFHVSGSNFFGNAPVFIKVGKALEHRWKSFYIEHENGLVDLNVDQRRLRIYSTKPGEKMADQLCEEYYKVDAFGNAISFFVDRIRDQSKPVATPISRAIDYLMDMFKVQRKMVLTHRELVAA